MIKNCYERPQGIGFHPKELPVNETVRRFLPMVDFLEQILGKNSEIVLHDFSDPDHAIVDIRNGIVSRWQDIGVSDVLYPRE